LSRLVHVYFVEEQIGDDQTGTHLHVRAPTTAFETKMQGLRTLGIVELFYSVLEKPFTLPSPVPRSPPARKLQEAENVRWAGSSNQHAADQNAVIRYRPYRKHSELFEGFSDAWINPDLLALIDNLDKENPCDGPEAEQLRKWFNEELPNEVWSFRALTSHFLELVQSEVRNFESTGLRARRPNSMNNYGLILSEMGLDRMIFGLQRRLVGPIAQVLLSWSGGHELESHHAFTVRYKEQEDTHLDVHMDESDVTFNVNLWNNGSAGALVFCGMNGAPNHRKFRKEYLHLPGYAVIHSGRHRHGAEDISGGVRTNLIVWSYSSAFRRLPKPKSQREESPPDHRCLSYTHDRDYGLFKAYPRGTEHFRGRGWCPLPDTEYQGFRPEPGARRAQASG